MSNATSTRRIGRQMLRAAEFVAANPGATQQRVAMAIGPHGSHNFGARVVQRALRAGLIVDRSAETGSRGYSLFAA